MVLIDVDAVTVTRPERDLLRDVSVTVSSGDRLGVVGINGTGKTTLLRIMAGAERPDAGVVRRGRDTTIAVLDQAGDLPATSVRDAVGGGWQGEAILDRLGMGAMIDAACEDLSGGEARRVDLARTLVTGADLLILDEPTNHLDIAAIHWLEEHLANRAGGLVLVSHDRHLLDRVCTRILELERGRAHDHDGGYDGFLEARAERAERAAIADRARRSLARRELQWLRRGAPARTSKSKAHLARAAAVIDQRPEAQARATELDLQFAVPRLGDKVIELHDVGHRHDDRWLLRHLDLRLGPRERLGIVGLNGSGKSTLLDLMAGRFEPIEGTVERGPTVRLGYHDQLGTTLDPARRVREIVAGDKGEADWRDKALMERFWFDEDTQWSPVGLLSGGERRRLQLVMVLAAGPNVLLLDEPTNDLDLDTLRALEDFLDDWPGALVVVSHDRAFLERAVDDVVVLDGRGGAGRFPGGYAAWEAQQQVRTSRRRARSATTDTRARRRSPQDRSRPSSGRSVSTIRHELKALEKEMTVLIRRRDELERELLDAAADHERLSSLGAALETVQQELATAEDRWLEVAGELENR